MQLYANGGQLFSNIRFDPTGYETGTKKQLIHCFRNFPWGQSEPKQSKQSNRGDLMRYKGDTPLSDRCYKMVTIVQPC